MKRLIASQVFPPHTKHQMLNLTGLKSTSERTEPNDGPSGRRRAWTNSEHYCRVSKMPCRADEPGRQASLGCILWHPWGGERGLISDLSSDQVQKETHCCYTDNKADCFVAAGVTHTHTHTRSRFYEVSNLRGGKSRESVSLPVTTWGCYHYNWGLVCSPAPLPPAPGPQCSWFRCVSVMGSSCCHTRLIFQLISASGRHANASTLTSTCVT